MTSLAFWSRTEKRRSLQQRLILRLLAVFAMAIVLLLAALALHMGSILNSMGDEGAQQQAETIAALVHRNTDDSYRLDQQQILRRFGDSARGLMFVVFDVEGEVIFSSTRSAQWILAPGLVREGSHRVFAMAGPSGIAICSGAVTIAGELRIGVASSCFDPMRMGRAIIGEFMEFSGWWLVPILIVLIFVASLTVKRTLAPLHAISLAASRIGPDATDVRLPEKNLPEEIRPLVEAFNRALDRLTQGFELQRRFTADAAHELRTPLAVLTARVDAVSNGPHLEGLRRDVQVMARIVEQLLNVARLDSGVLDLSAPVDLREVAVEAISRLVPLALRQGRSIELSGYAGEVLIRGNEAALTTALLNLIENALIQTPRGGVVEVAIEAAGVIRVLDQGPGVPLELRAELFHRFRRGPANRSAGSGLGLAIVAQTVELHHGKVEIGEAPKGGAMFSMSFPRMTRIAPLYAEAQSARGRA